MPVTLVLLPNLVQQNKIHSIELIAGFGAMRLLLGFALYYKPAGYPADELLLSNPAARHNQNLVLVLYFTSVALSPEGYPCYGPDRPQRSH